MFRLSISGILSTMPFLDVYWNSWCRFILLWSHWVRTYDSVNLSAMWLLAFANHANWKRFTDTQRNAKAYLSLILSMFSILQLINNIHFSTQTKNDLVHYFHLYKIIILMVGLQFLYLYALRFSLGDLLGCICLMPGSNACIWVIYFAPFC